MIESTDKLEPGNRVQWSDDAGHHIGHELTRGGIVVKDHYWMSSTEPGKAVSFEKRLIREYHTGDLMFVNAELLSEYPSEPIPQP